MDLKYKTGWLKNRDGKYDILERGEIVAIVDTHQEARDKVKENRKARMQKFLTDNKPLSITATHEEP